MSKLNKLFGLLFMVFAMSCAANAQLGINWTPAPSLLSARDSGAALADNTSNIYLLGGNTALPTSVDKLSPNAAAWTAATAIPLARIAPGLVNSNGQFYLYGGKVNGRAVRDAGFYDPVSGLITNPSSMSIGRYRFAAASSFGYVFAIGGLDRNEAPIPTVERFILGAKGKTWVTLAPLPEARSNFPAVSDAKGYIYTFGGSIAGSPATTTVFKYSVFTNTWSTVAPMPIAVNDSTAIAGANNLIYVIGGSSGTGQLNNVQIYDSVNDTWRQGTPLPFPLKSASSAIDSNGKLVVMGGIDQTNVNTPLVWTSPQADAPPVITSFIFNSTLVAGQTYSNVISARGTPQPTYSIVSAPSGMTVDSGTGLISWIPTVSQIGVNNVTLRATNPTGTADQSFSVSVAPTAPNAVEFTDVTADSARMSWASTMPEGTPATYNVYRRFCRGGRGGGCGNILFASGLSLTKATLTGLVYGTGYSFGASTVVNGVESPVGPLAVFTTLRTAPPTNVTVTAVTQGSVSLSWTPPVSSPLPVTAYRIYENGIVRIDNIVGTTATVSGLLPNSQHFFYVAALDANFVPSFFAAASVVTTSSLPSLFHTSMFPRPANYGNGFFAESLVAVNGGNLMLVSAEAHSSAPVDYVVGAVGMPTTVFSLFAGPAGMTVDPVTGVVSWLNVSSPVGTFSATVRGTNNVGSTDFIFNYTVYAAGTDLLSPTEPTYFSTNATNITSTSATINWTASTDNVGVAGYRVFMSSPPPPCGTIGGCAPPSITITPVATVDGNTTSATITGLIPNSRYGMWIQAFDAAGNTCFITAAVRPTFTTLP
jgi:hypothetical protein